MKTSMMMWTGLVLGVVIALAACGEEPAQVGDDAGAAFEVDAGTMTVDGQAVDAPAPDGGAVDNTPGKHTHHLVADFAQREVLVYVPQRAVGQRVPVVMMLHGTSGDGEKFFNISGWREKADAEGFIAVFPTAMVYCEKEDENYDGDFDDPGEKAVTTKWAAGKLGTAVMPVCTAAELALLTPAQRALADHPIYDDVAYIRGILDLLAQGYVIDTHRVYVSGFSNGGSMAGRLAQEMSDRFAAVSCASGFMDSPGVPVASPITVVLDIGELDEKMLAKLAIPALPLDEAMLTTVPLVKSNVVTPMLTVMQLADGYVYDERLVGGQKVTRFTYAMSIPGAPAGLTNRLELLAIGGLEHQYPNGINSPVVMADYLWSVFRERSLP
jgi:polyhydroxybutyrate depolymerase